MSQLWLRIEQVDLETEFLQATQEGRDLSSVASEFERLSQLDLSQSKNQRAAENLLDGIQQLPFASLPSHEPPDWQGEVKDLLPKLNNAWLGRCCGCLLGKPVEGKMRAEIERLLRDKDQLPLDDYITHPDIKWSKETITCMPEDDDLNYTTCGIAIAEKHGVKPTSEQIADFWLGNIPLLHTCTAERVAYKNLTNGIPPPQSASFRNPYREWIGAQIRADFWGYINPGNPKAATLAAFNDARISHVENGIYGEMWAASMIAIAFAIDDPREIIEKSLEYIPQTSRLSEGIRAVLQDKTDDDAINNIHQRWDEKRAHDWCHTISNAEIVTAALLFGEGDFEKSICLAVQAGFDTDCNGATVGSVLGATGRIIPKKWSDPLNDTLETGVQGFHRVKISEMAARTLALTQSP